MPQNAPFTVVIVLVVAARFLMRELRERHLSQTQLFVLPVVVGAIALAYAAAILHFYPARAAELALESAVAIAAGAGIGFLVARFTTVRTAADGRVFFIGSYVTVVIWIGALLLRVFARFVLAGTGSPGETAVANVALVVLVAAALTVTRVLVRRKAIQERLGGRTLAETAL